MAGAALLLSGCATPLPDATPTAAPATQWHATLPHGGNAQAMAAWWNRFDDPLLAALIADAQASSPTLAQAVARVTQARATQRAAEGSRLPAAELQAQGTRGVTLPNPVATQASVGPQASWEIDVFGGQRHNAEAARARAEQARLGWHDARVSLAAEVAQAYIGLRGCEALEVVYSQEAQSQARTASLTREKLRVGFEAPANAALADALAAQSRDRRVAQHAECDGSIKLLVLLTGQDEPALRERLAARAGVLPRSEASLAIAPVPAALLAQRPDIASAEQELIGAAADVGVAEAARWPQITLSGNVSWSLVRSAGVQTDGVAWGFGPSLLLPLFNGGRLAAQADAARGRYDEARAGFEQRLRGAVREVEDALVRLDAAERREADAQTAADGLREYFNAAETRWQIGAGSLIDMEDARRTALSAQAGLIGVQRERVAASVSLYRAAGGGWTRESSSPNL